MTTKTELDAIVTNAMPSGNVAFSVTDQPDGLTTDRFKATQRAAKRRDGKSRAALKRERVERQKELGNDSPMSVDEFNEAIDFVRDEFGIILHSNYGGYSFRPKITRRELLALSAGVDEGTSIRDRVLAVKRLSRLGFRVQFVGLDPRLP